MVKNLSDFDENVNNYCFVDAAELFRNSLPLNGVSG